MDEVRIKYVDEVKNRWNQGFDVRDGWSQGWMKSWMDEDKDGWRQGSSPK